MAPTIEISDELYALLEREARPFVETTPEAVLRRLLKDYLDGSRPSRRVGPGPDSESRPRPADRRGRSRTGARAKRARRGSLLPEREYELPILRALDEAGGTAPSRVVTETVGKALADRLTDIDKEQLRSGDIRWQNRVQFTRLRLVEEGLLKKDSPRGTWEISDKGRQRLSSGDVER
jgi:Mrr N-terminal domain